MDTYKVFWFTTRFINHIWQKMASSNVLNLIFEKLRNLVEYQHLYQIFSIFKAVNLFINGN